MNQENLSQILLDQMNLHENSYQLTADAPIYRLEHPGLVKTRLTSEADLPPLPETFFGFHWETSSSLEEAQKKYPALKVSKGKPCDLHRWMHSKTPMIFDFTPLGILVLEVSLPCKNPDLLDHSMAVWFNYATSIELWGPQGKWNRFHERLLVLFNRHNLLVEQSYPGFYRLDPKTNWISSHGFVGDLLPNELQITFPWDFPLSAIVKLEKLILEN